MIHVSNIVCSAELGCPIDLLVLTQKIMCNVRYDAKRHNVVIWKHKKIGGNCLVYARGKIVCNGAVLDEKEARLRLRRYARQIQRHGWPVNFHDVKILTMSLTHSLNGHLRLNLLKNTFAANYEPELFPGAIVSRGHVRFTCFHSGKVVISGVKDQRDIEYHVYPTLMELELLCDL